MIRPEISLCDKKTLPEASCDIIMEDMEERVFDSIKVKCIHTPGHTDGSCCYEIGGLIFSGDTIFNRNIGRCDLPTGDFDVIYKSIKEKIYKYPDETVIYPGHGTHTTVGYEKKYNAYVTE